MEGYVHSSEGRGCSHLSMGEGPSIPHIMKQPQEAGGHSHIQVAGEETATWGAPGEQSHVVRSCNPLPHCHFSWQGTSWHRLVPLHPSPLGLEVAVRAHLHWAASQTPSCPQKMAVPRLGVPHRGPGKADSRGWCPWSWGSLVLLVEPPPHI